MADVRYSGRMSEMKETFERRAVAHARAAAVLKPVARWRNGVTDADVAAVFYAVEALGVRLGFTATGRWIPYGATAAALRLVDTTTTAREMIRTGLMRTWRTSRGEHRLTPARVHLRDPLEPAATLCRDAVEGMPGGRVRTVDDLLLVDCLECEASVVRGGPREL